MEVLVAITIFTIAVAGIITAAVQGGINVNADEQRVTANYLAQEGIELMRDKRDSYVVSSPSGYDAGWADFVAATTTACSTTTPCDIDVSDTTSAIPSSGAALGLRYVTCTATSCVLNYDSNGYYSHSAGTASLYTRKITVVPYPTVTPDELLVTSTVTWLQGSAPQTVSQSESLFDWYSALSAP